MSPFNFDDYNFGDFEDEEGSTSSEDTKVEPTADEVEEAVASGDIKVIGKEVFDSLGQLLGTISNNRTLANIVSAWKTNKDRGTYADRTNYFSKVATDNLINFANELKGTAPPAFLQFVQDTVRAVQGGRVDPAQAMAAVQEQSRMNNVQVPQYIKDTQNEVLGRLGDVSRNGYTVVERAAIQKALDQVQGRVRGETEAIKDDLRSRGQYGSGSELALRMMAQQAGANQASQQALDIEAAGLKRALDALQAQGQQANTLNQQEFTQRSATAQAQDQINQFNAQMQQSIGLANQAATNQANQFNSSQQQQVNLTNAQLAQQAQQRQLEAAKAEYEAKQKQQQMQQGALTSAAGNAAGMYRAPFELEGKLIDAQNRQLNTAIAPNAAGSAANTAKDIGQIVDTGVKLWNTGSKLWDYFSDEDLKENKKELSEEEVLATLDKLIPTSYQYTKKGKHMGAPDGTIIGVMAQDIEKTPAKGMVYKESGVRKVKGDEALQLALAAVSALNKRIDDIEGK